MNFRYNVTFTDGSTPHYHFTDSKIKIEESVNKWVSDANTEEDTNVDIIDVYSDGDKYRITNSGFDEWVVFRLLDWCADELEIFSTLGQAMDFIEDLEEN